MVTQVSSFDRQPFNYHELASYGLLTMLVGFVLLLLGIGGRYAMPSPQLVIVGRQQDLARQLQPIAVSSPGPVADFFLVREDGEWQALDAQTPYPTRCKVLWVADNRRFEDPCSGSKFARNGGYLEGPANGHMRQYPVHVQADDRVVVDLSQPLVETQASFVQRCLVARQSDAAPVLNIPPSLDDSPFAVVFGKHLLTAMC
jgi:hypothetical protein